MNNPWQGLNAAMARKAPKRRVAAFDNPWSLSATQCFVLREFTKGMTAKEIAAALGKSPKTIEVHLANCRSAMGGVRGVQMAVMWDRFERQTVIH